MEVKPATIEDIELLQDLFSQAISWQKQRGLPTFSIFTDSFFEQEISNGNVFLAWNQERLVGTISLYEEDKILWGNDQESALYIHRLASARDVTGRGVGAALIVWSRRQAEDRKKRWLRVDCWAENRELCEFYERQGFEKVRDKNTGANPAWPKHYQNIELRLFQMELIKMF